jgi:hypothetical protein
LGTYNEKDVVRHRHRPEAELDRVTSDDIDVAQHPGFQTQLKEGQHAPGKVQKHHPNAPAARAFPLPAHRYHIALQGQELTMMKHHIAEQPVTPNC